MNPLLTKLMMLTTSDNDNEALSAMRKANAILAEDNVNWEEFLNALDITRRNKEASVRRQQRRANDDANAFTDVTGRGGQRFDDETIINSMFERAFANAGQGGFRDFLESVHQWWETKKFLTEKQYYAIKKAADA